MAASAVLFSWFYNAAALAVCAAVLATGMYLLARRADGRDGALAAYALLLALFMGVMVNPVQVGASPLLDNRTRLAVAAIDAADPDARWAVTGEASSAYADLAATAGASVVNTCNVYPNLELWRRFDPQGSFDATYNRYAHISIVVAEGPTAFTEAGFDSFTLSVNPNDVPLLEVDYLLSTQDLAALSTDKVRFQQVGDEVDGRAVYRVDALPAS